MFFILNRFWLEVLVDVCGFFFIGEMVLVFLDVYLKYFEVEIIFSIIVGNIFLFLEWIFVIYGILEVLKIEIDFCFKVKFFMSLLWKKVFIIGK